MRVRWIKVWVDAMATLTERFRDDEGRVDFEALGREEYAFRHALVTGDFSRSERARDLYDATINEITSRSEAGRKGAEARWNKNTADAPHREVGDDVTDTGNRALLESGTSAETMGRVAQNEAPAHGFSGGRTAQGTMSRSPEAAAQSGKDYDQEPDQVSTDEALESQHGAGEVTPESVSAHSPALPAKHPHGEFGNVMLTTDEYIKLCEKCQDADSLITELDQYIESQGKTKKYKSHYATLLNWSRRKAQEAKPKQGYLTSDDISKKNYQESKARLEAMFSKGRETA
jgi:hypothetical protein